MFDMHYDLLSRLYYDYIKYGEVTNNTKNDLKKIFNSSNIVGGFINLYFMNEKEMYEEAGLTLSQLENVVGIFKKCVELIEMLKIENIISKDIKFIYGIEGCDYIKDEHELDELYNLGLRSILLVWNNQNKYGSGNESDAGITKEGINFIRHAIELGIIIDVSHANYNTFYGILDVVREEKEKGKDVILIASHSNARDICDVPRNLTYQQLVDLKELGGYIGLVGYNLFLGNDNFKEQYLRNIDYMINEIGFGTDKILVSTDNMSFLGNYDNTFDIHSIGSELCTLLLNRYSKDIVNKILYLNAFNILNKVNGYEKKRLI